MRRGRRLPVRVCHGERRVVGARRRKQVRGRLPGVRGAVTERPCPRPQRPVRVGREVRERAREIGAGERERGDRGRYHGRSGGAALHARGPRAQLPHVHAD